MIKVRIVILFVLVSIGLFSQEEKIAMNSSIIFKVQVGKGMLSPASFENIDELSFFTLPSGSKMYFSGGSYKAYQNAEKEMERVEALGYEAAVLTAFKHGQELPMSSREVRELISRQKEHEAYVLARAQELKELEKSRLEKAKEEALAREQSALRLKKEAERKRRKMSLEEFERLSSEHLTEQTVSNNSSGSLASSDKEESKTSIVSVISKEESENHEENVELINKEDEEVEVVEPISSIEDIIQEEKMVKRADFQLLVEERPVYMICIGQFNEGDKGVKGSEWAKLSQVVYKHTCRNVNYFVFGSYTNIKEAAKSLAAAKSMGLNNATIVGYYMNSVTSVNLATQLIEIFDSYQD